MSLYKLRNYNVFGCYKLCNARATRPFNFKGLATPDYRFGEVKAIDKSRTPA